MICTTLHSTIIVVRSLEPYDWSISTTHLASGGQFEKPLDGAIHLGDDGQGAQGGSRGGQREERGIERESRESREQRQTGGSSSKLWRR